MTRILALVRRFPLVTLTVAIGLVAGSLVAADLEPGARWLISLFALAIAAVEAVRMIRGLLSKQFGLDILAVTAIVSTIVVGEYWASLVIVLMLTGGEALEVAAAGRAQRELRSLLDRVPQLAHRLEANGDVVDVAADQVQVGDRLRVRQLRRVVAHGREPARRQDDR